MHLQSPPRTIPVDGPANRVYAPAYNRLQNTTGCKNRKEAGAVRQGASCDGLVMDMTIRKLAQLAGTSYSTVSRALNDSPLVKDSTKRHIQSLARQLGYQVNSSAKSLATGMQMNVGLVYPFHSLRPYESAYTSQAISRMRRELATHGLDALVAGYGGGEGPTDDITRLLRQKKVAGLIIFGYEVSRPQVDALLRLDAPFLLINPAPGIEDAPCHQIRIDHELGGYLAAQRLIAAGRRRLLCVTEAGEQFDVRLRGFARAVADAEEAITWDTLTIENGLYETAYDTVAAHLDEVRACDGVFAQSDLTSIGVLNCLLDTGVPVPEQISVVGYDDIEWAQYTRPALTTIHQPVSEVARLATDAIAAVIAGTQSDQYVEKLQPTLVDRESC